MRLRPSGASGLMVSEIERFGEYQANEAWTWEHQAFSALAFVFGDNSLAVKFSRIRACDIGKPRDKTELQKAVREMRQKMRDHLLKASDGMFDSKQSPGGIVDIEFIAQYLVLANAHEYPELTIWSDNADFGVLLSFEPYPAMSAQHLTPNHCLLRMKIID